MSAPGYLQTQVDRSMIIGRLFYIQNFVYSSLTLYHTIPTLKTLKKKKNLWKTMFSTMEFYKFQRQLKIHLCNKI